jgi:hypothetical protein
MPSGLPGRLRRAVIASWRGSFIELPRSATARPSISALPSLGHRSASCTLSYLSAPRNFMPCPTIQLSGSEFPLRGNRCPALMVTGELEPLNPIEQTEAVYEALSGPRELWVFEDEIPPLEVGRGRGRPFCLFFCRALDDPGPRWRDSRGPFEKNAGEKKRRGPVRLDFIFSSAFYF